MKKYILTLLCLLFANATQADVTGAGDAAILGELVAQTKMLAQELQKIEDTINIQKRIEQLEELKAAKKLYEEGKAFQNIVKNVARGKASMERMKDNPFGTQGIIQDVNWLDTAIEEAEEAGDYAHIAVELRNLRFLGQANSASTEKIAKGTNQEENTQITSSNTSIVANLLLKEEERRMKIEMAEEKIFKALFLGEGVPQ